MSAPHSTLPARVWAAVTIEAAWTLQVAGVRCTQTSLAEVRRHVLLSLPHDVGEDHADAMTAPLVRDFLARFRERDYRRSLPAEAPRPLKTLWRDAMLEGLDPVGVTVWRLVYSDGLSLEAAEERCRVDRVVLAGAREGLRYGLRELIGEALDARELDELLARLARMPSPDCDGGIAALSAGRDHIERCPRCCRAQRLARAGLLTQQSLRAPPGGWTRERISVLALNLHPEGRHHLPDLCDTFGPAARVVGDDTVFIELDRAPNHVSVLYALAEEGTPSKLHIRGALVRGPGRWHPKGLIGPVARTALTETAARQWGEIDTVGTLPGILPPPPSALPWWGTAAAVALLAGFVGLRALRESPPAPTYPLDPVSFQRVDDAVAGRFDVDDRAYTLVVLDGPSGLEVLHADERPADKGVLATGEGDFYIDAEGRQLLIAASAEPFTGIEDLLALVRSSPRPLDELAARLDTLHDSLEDLVIQPLPPSVDTL